MIQRALTGELEPHEDRALQKSGRKKQAKSPPLVMELPDLNTALLEAYRDLDCTNHAAKTNGTMQQNSPKASRTCH